MKRKNYSGFHPLNWEESHIYLKNFFNDWEIVKLTNFLNQQETQIILIINYCIKKSSRFNQSRLFKIPYQEISEKVGIDKNTIRKKLSSLKNKQILEMISNGAWAWNKEGIKNLLSPRVEIKATPIGEKSYFAPVNPVSDPMFLGLNLDQKF